MGRMRWVILVLCMLVCLTTEAFAAQQNGLEVRITSNKKHYDLTEIAEVAVAVENTMDRAVYNVKIANALPEDLKRAAEPGILFIDEIPAHSTVKKGFHIMKSGVILTIQSDKECYERDEIAELTITVANHGDSAIHDIDVASYLPDGLQYVTMKDNEVLRFPRIDAGESVSQRIRVKVMDPLPQTGDDTSKPLLMYAMLLVLSTGLLIRYRRGTEIRQ